MGVRVWSDASGEEYQLIDDELGEVVDASRFLTAIHVRGLSPRTVRAYAFDLLTLYRWLAQSDRRPDDLQQSDLLDFIRHERQRGAHPHSINRRLTTSRLFYRFLTGREIESNIGAMSPAPHYKGRGRHPNLGLHRLPKLRPRLRVKTARLLVEPLSGAEVRAFLRSVRRYRDLAIVYLMLLCGLRTREVMCLEVSDISFDENRFRVRGKGDRERMLPLPEILRATLIDYCRLERPPQTKSRSIFVLLQGPRRGRPMTAAGIRSLFRNRRRSSELAKANPHRFRHTFGADMARAGVRLPVLQKMMGHANGITTLQYINLSMADVAEEYKRAQAIIQKRYRKRP